MPSTTTTTSSTYILGEDAGRLAQAARHLGLAESRPLMRPVRQFFVDDAAARMHSVGTIGRDERIDTTGTLHYVSVRRRRRVPEYGSLDGLFQKEASMREEEEEEEEIVVEDVVEGGSLQAAIFGIVKGTVGPAILYLPHGFQNSGYGIAIPAMLFATLMYVYNSHRLLDCWRIESEKNHKRAARMEEIRALLETAPATATQADNETSLEAFTPTLLTYPELARRALGPFSFLVNLGIALMQFGVCLTYLIFVPQNLQESFWAMSGRMVPKTVFLAFMLLVELPLSWITDIRKLTPTNVIATLLIAYGLCAVLILAFVVGLSRSDDSDELVFSENLSKLPFWTDSWFIFIGTSFFMMEGSITLLVPLQEAVFLPEDKVKFPAVNQKVTTWIVMFYIVFSMICVCAFGNGIRTAMTASLRGTVATTVQLAYSIAVILTFPLQAFPAMQVAARAVLGDTTSQLESPKRSVLATFMVLLLGVIAVVAIDYLGNVVSILGSLFGIPLALVFPPLMHNSLIKDSTWRTKTTNFVVVGIGFGAMAAASYATIVSWDKGAEGD